MVSDLSTENNDVVAIIPARSGSKGLRDKNVSLVGGFPLLAFSIAAAQMSSTIGRTILSTDSEEYADLGRRYGAEVPFLRPAELSTDTATDRGFFVHAMDWMRENEGHLPEFWVHLRPTTPLRDPSHLDDAVTLIQERSDATALRSAHPAPESPFKWFRRNDEGVLTGLTSDETSLDRYNLPRQSYPEAYIPDGYVDVVRASLVLETSFVHGDKVLGYVSPDCVEVDSMAELERLDFDLQKHGSPIWDYLKRHHQES
jgi:CMP-N,N'-diacetyllegionaminic acid synthase